MYTLEDKAALHVLIWNDLQDILVTEKKRQAIYIFDFTCGDFLWKTPQNNSNNYLLGKKLVAADRGGKKPFHCIFVCYSYFVSCVSPMKII